MTSTEAKPTFTYARTANGKIDTGAYKGIQVLFSIPDMDVKVEGTVIDARIRYGHLDLLVSPTKGTGTKWFERKNVILLQDPAAGGAPAIDSQSENQQVEQVVESARNAWGKLFRAKL